jgi:ATP synthase protein I
MQAYTSAANLSARNMPVCYVKAVDMKGNTPVNVRMQKRLPLHRLPVFQILIAQLVVAILISAALLIWLGWSSGYSGFLGGAIAWLPNLYFARKAFRYSGARAARDILKSFYAGEAGKFVLTAALFALVFAGVKPLDARSVFVVFILTQMVSWFAPLLIKAKPLRP